MLKIEYTIVCDHCGAMVGSKHDVLPGWAVPPAPVLPDDWQAVNGTHVCPKHKVLIDKAQEGPQGA